MKELKIEYQNELETILTRYKVVVKDKVLKDKNISLNLNLSGIQFYISTHRYMVESENFFVLPVYIRIQGLGAELSRELKKKSYVYRFVMDLLHLFNRYWDEVSEKEGYEGFVYIDRSQETNEFYRLKFDNIVVETGKSLSPKTMSFMEHFLYEYYQFAYIGARIKERANEKMETFLQSWSMIQDAFKEFGLASLYSESRGFLGHGYIHFFEGEGKIDCCGSKLLLKFYDNYQMCKIVNEQQELLFDGLCTTQNILDVFESIQEENTIANLLEPPIHRFEFYVKNMPGNILSPPSDDLIEREYNRLIEKIGSWEEVFRMFRNHFNRIIPKEEISVYKKEDKQSVIVHHFEYKNNYIYLLLFKESQLKTRDLRIILSEEENPIELKKLLESYEI